MQVWELAARFIVMRLLRPLGPLGLVGPLGRSHARHTKLVFGRAKYGCACRNGLQVLKVVIVLTDLQALQITRSSLGERPHRFHFFRKENFAEPRGAHPRSEEA